MISQLFILSPRGDVIIKKEYRHDVPKTSQETFFRAVRFWKDAGAFYTLVPIRPRWRGERRSLRTFAGVSLRPGSPAFNPRPRRLSTTPDAFELHPDIASERAPAVFAEDGVHYLHVKANGLFLATTTRKNVSPSHVLELLHRVAKVIKDYCGVMNEDALRKNSVLAYELLDEMIDRVYAQVRSLHWSPYDRVGVVNADP